MNIRPLHDRVIVHRRATNVTHKFAVVRLPDIRINPARTAFRHDRADLH